MLATDGDLSPELTESGLSMGSSVASFWTYVSQHMTPQDSENCKKIAADLASTHMAINIRAMSVLAYDDMKECIRRNGGKITWMRSVETLLGHSFERSSTVPPSAQLVLDEDSVACMSRASTGPEQAARLARAQAKGKQREENFYDELMRTGELLNFKLDKDAIHKVCVETTDPSSETLSRNDTKAVTDYVFQFVKETYNQTGCSVTLFKHLAKQLQDYVPKPYNPKVKYAKKLEYRFEAGNRSNYVTTFSKMKAQRKPLETLESQGAAVPPAPIAIAHEILPQTQSASQLNPSIPLASAPIGANGIELQDVLEGERDT